MNDFDVTGTDFHLLSAVELRKFAAKAGVKGASKGKKAELIAALEVIEASQLEAARIEIEAAKAAAAPAPAKTVKAPKLCSICNKRRPSSKNGKSYADQCDPCHQEGGWENTHSDGGHDAILEIGEADRTDAQAEEIDGCWICFPELNEAKKERTVRTGVNRQGQVVVAKGDKAEVFRAAAEAAGYDVKVDTETSFGYVTASAAKDGKLIELVWFADAYLYGASFVEVAGKRRKIRNLKEALRLI
jgi:hypothetical protein